MVASMRLARRISSSSSVEFASQQEGVEREAVARGRDLGADDVGAVCRAGAGKQREQPRVVGREDREFGDGGKRVRHGIGDEFAVFMLRATDKASVARLLGGLRAQPIVGIVPIDEVFDFGARPVG